jgi:hypothetical protein
MKGRGRTVGIIVAGILGLLFLHEQWERADEQAHPERTAAAINVAKEAVRRVQPQMLASVDTSNTKANDYSITLYYREGPYVSSAVARADMEAVARTILSILVSQGRRPSKENTFIWVSGWQHTHGETGEKLYFDLGHVVYHYTDDRLEYYPRTSW